MHRPSMYAHNQTLSYGYLVQVTVSDVCSGLRRRLWDKLDEKKSRIQHLNSCSCAVYIDHVS